MEIKTFEFVTSCYKGNLICHSNDADETFLKTKCISSENIDKTINDFLDEKMKHGYKVVDIKENFYTLNRHNNGGYDIIIRNITIILN